MQKSTMLGIIVALLALAGGAAFYLFSTTNMQEVKNNDQLTLNGIEPVADEVVFEQNDNVVVKKGDVIVVDYVGKLTDGTVFDTSIESVAKENDKYNPARDYTSGLEFTVGAGQMIKGFDAGVVGMKLGETKTVEIPAAEAYGEVNPEMVIRVPLEQAGDISGATVGMQVLLGNMYPAKITEITDKEIVFDMNHELAGKDLIFDITVKEIKSTPQATPAQEANPEAPTAEENQ